MKEGSFASLGPTLLARKGGAKPAMRRQLGAMPSGAGAAAHLEDLGWNDMGEDDAPDSPGAKVLPLTPAEGPDVAEAAPASKPAVHSQREEIAARLTDAESAPAKEVTNTDAQTAPKVAKVAEKQTKAAKPRKRRSALARGKRAAFTLRLDQERHLKLRLACTMNNTSAQQFVIEALDTMLGKVPELDKLAAQMRRS